ncbi:MAG: Mrp/NBP35 family ATP-binding protein [Sphingorhabdus sp.]
MLRKLSEKRVRDALVTVMHPFTGKDMVASDVIEHILIKDGIVTLTIQINPKTAEAMEPIGKRCEAAVSKLSGVKSVRVILTAQRPEPPSDEPQLKRPMQASKPPAPPPPKPLTGVKRILAVASGKGGVGKSTTSINLATAFSQMGWNVGIMDCDIYGPSVQRMLGSGEKPDFTDDDRIKPVSRHGMKAISMGHLIPEDRATIWRGPMVIGAVQQLLNGVAWDIDGDLDILIVDLPPGTGDAQLTLVQTVPLTGVIIVSTPQDIALIDARKAYDMFEQTKVPILGMIENMSSFSCPKCGENTDIFGHGGARETAQEKQIPFLGEIPLHLDIRIHADDGTPIILAQPDGDHAKIYMDIAASLAEKMPAPPE